VEGENHQYYDENKENTKTKLWCVLGHVLLQTRPEKTRSRHGKELSVCKVQFFTLHGGPIIFDQSSAFKSRILREGEILLSHRMSIVSMTAITISKMPSGQRTTISSRHLRVPHVLFHFNTTTVSVRMRVKLATAGCKFKICTSYWDQEYHAFSGVAIGEADFGIVMLW